MGSLAQVALRGRWSGFGLELPWGERSGAHELAATRVAPSLPAIARSDPRSSRLAPWWLPKAVEPAGPGGIYARLEELGHRLDRFDEEVRARMPSPDEVKLLRLASGVPVIHLIRTAYDTEGRAVEVCDTVMAADAYVLAYQLPAQ